MRIWKSLGRFCIEGRDVQVEATVVDNSNGFAREAWMVVRSIHDVRIVNSFRFGYAIVVYND